jgi:hypothetical protein
MYLCEGVESDSTSRINSDAIKLRRIHRPRTESQVQSQPRCSAPFEDNLVMRALSNYRAIGVCNALW